MDRYGALNVDGRYDFDKLVKDTLKRSEGKSRKSDNPGKDGSTICWGCANAVPHFDEKRRRYTRGCEWSIYGQKVPGWEAIESPHTSYLGPSFNVRKCPKFERG